MVSLSSLRLSERLTHHNRPDQKAVAWDEIEQRFVTEKEWRRRVAAWFQAACTQNVRSVLFYSDDTIEASAALMGLWAAGVRVFWPGSAQAHVITLTQNEDPEVFLAGDFVPFATLKDRCLIVSKHAKEPEKWPRFSLTRPQLYLWTSGSTGTPKIITKTLTQLFAEVRALDQLYLSYCPNLYEVNPIVWASVTHQHMYGLAFRLLWPLLGHGLLTRSRQHYPESFVAHTKAAPGSALIITTPTHIERFDDTRLLQSVPSYFVVSSTAPLSADGVQKCYRAFARTPMEILGSTESGILAHRMRSIERGSVVDAPCYPTPGMTLTLADKNAPYQRGDIGLMCATSAQLAPQTRPMNDRIRITSVDNEGRIKSFDFLGRNDTILKIEGTRISASALEKRVLAIQEHGQPLFTFVSILLPKGATRVHLVGVLSKLGQDWLLDHGKAALRRRILRHLQDKFPRVALPRFLRFVSTRPQNPQGKTPQRLLVRLFDPRRPEWLLTERVETEKRQHYQWKMTLQPQLRWFEGHFPALAILPGVASLELVRMAYSEILGREATLMGFRHLKFKKIVRPHMTMQLDLTVQADKATFTWSICQPDGSTRISAQGQLSFA